MSARARWDGGATWLATIAIAAAVALAGLHCVRDVPLGVDPGSDAAAVDGGGGADADGGAT